MRAMHKDKKAFTLIEIIVVIAIIGILAMIVSVSTVAIMRNSEKKGATTTLSQYWSISTTTFDMINKRITTYTQPDAVLLATRLNVDSSKLTVSTADCKELSEGKIYIQYTDNPKNNYTRYTLKRILINYKGTIYYTDDGKKAATLTL